MYNVFLWFCLLDLYGVVIWFFEVCIFCFENGYLRWILGFRAGVLFYFRIRLFRGRRLYIVGVLCKCSLKWIKTKYLDKGYFFRVLGSYLVFCNYSEFFRGFLWFFIKLFYNCIYIRDWLGFFILLLRK